MTDATTPRERITDRAVLLVISVGLIGIILSIIIGIFRTDHTLPNWAENVLVALGTAAILKLGDCLSALIALSTGKTTERLSTQLANTVPVDSPAPTPPDAKAAAAQVAGAATDEADKITNEGATT